MIDISVLEYYLYLRVNRTNNDPNKDFGDPYECNDNCIIWL